MKKVCKKISCILMSLIFMIGSITITAMADEGITVQLNGVQLTFDVAPQMIHNRTMVPMRKIFESLGAEVAWNETTQTITATKDDTKIVMQIKKTDMQVNDKTITLDVPPQIVEDRTFVPVRAVAESFNADVEWDNESSTVKITSKNNSIFALQMADDNLSMLDNRLNIKMPTGTKDAGVWYGKSAESHEETSYILEANGQKLTVVANELFLYSSGNIKDDANTLMKRWSDSSNQYTLSDMKFVNNLDVIEFTPNQMEAVNNTVLIKGAIVKNSDNTLMLIDVYVNEQAFENKDNCINLSESILNTIQSGTRKLNTKAHDEELNGLVSGQKMHISLQDNYVLTNSHGPDFTVFYITKIVTVGDSQPTMGIYSGNYPSILSANISSSQLQKSSDNILGNNIQWTYYKSASDSFMETVFNESKSNTDTKMHIFMHPKADENLDEMKKMAESLKLG